MNITFQINKTLEQITTSVQKFGDIKVTSDQFKFPIDKWKDRQAQIMIALPSEKIENLTFTLQKHINTELTNVHGCSLLPDVGWYFPVISETK